METIVLITIGALFGIMISELRKKFDDINEEYNGMERSIDELRKQNNELKLELKRTKTNIEAQK